MSIDENGFFKQAAVQLFKDIEEGGGLPHIHTFLADFIPIAAISLFSYDYDSGQFRTVATSGEGDWTAPPKLLLLSREEQAFMQAGRGLRTQVGRISQVHGEPPVVQAIFRQLGAGDSPFMYMRMEMRDGGGGVLVHSANGVDFTKAHQGLLRLLANPFSWAVNSFLRYRDLNELQNRLKGRGAFLEQETEQGRERIVGAEFGLRYVMDQVRQVAPMDSSVLIMGETGVGKEIIADAVRLCSNRHDKPFIKVNCGAIPENLVDSELFGHERGAFTGAFNRKKGRFERAHLGTIFLDEIGELPLSAQVRLLRVLQHHEFERVGGAETIPLDVRIIAATNRNLESMIEEGLFREDLFFRLNVFPISIPPLRHRIKDIPALVDYFIKKKTREMNLDRNFYPAPGTVENMIQYAWPGNVRELENVVEREIIRSNSVPGETLIYFGRNTPGRGAPRKRPPAGHIVPLDQAIIRHIQLALIKSAGKVEGPQGAAAVLGINPSTLRSKMRRLGIKFGRSVKTSDCNISGQ